ncbi:tRNA1(Val) (adenine(37)-N6)-methyltransferase [Oceanivirga miroungae]|uniref:Methyltransferase small n=1 Tax=Oceanivirga miroungae TaxID=1130046 RepID=A0A6I8MER1_9FUSO|nr:methyltransferase [Oceanivirga miroungae]VWL85584.1 methyltransferase small [Oceanivirga miroungae]
MHEVEIRGLKILQDPSMQGMSLDGVLLEDFIKINRNSKKILEIGSGNANISMLLSKRTKAFIDAVEIQEKACDIAKINVENNEIENINLVCEDIKKYKKDEMQVYDIIFSNPPYFKNEKNLSQMRNGEEKIIARNEVLLSLEELIKISSRLLKNNGHLYLVFRTSRLIDILTYVKKYKMSSKHLKFVYTSNEKESIISLLDIVKNTTSETHVLSPIYVYENGKKSKYIEQLYGK